MSNPSTSAWPDGSGRLDNRMAANCAQHLPRDLLRPSSGLKELEIDRYGFFGADTDTSTIHGPIADTDISQIFKSCFLLHYQKLYVFYALPFLKNFKNQDL